MPDARCTRRLACKKLQENAHEHTGSAENIRHSLRKGEYGGKNSLKTMAYKCCVPFRVPMRCGPLIVLFGMALAPVNSRENTSNPRITTLHCATVSQHRFA
jgi:hypothetical protein